MRLSFPPPFTGEVARAERVTEGALRGERKAADRARALRRRMTDAEIILWSRIRPRVWPHQRFRRQHPIGPYIADFACPMARLVIEIDGGTHGSDKEREYDRRRDAHLASQGWRVIRVWNEDVYKRLGEVLELIAGAAPPPPLRGPPPP